MLKSEIRKTAQKDIIDFFHIADISEITIRGKKNTKTPAGAYWDDPQGQYAFIGGFLLYYEKNLNKILEFLNADVINYCNDSGYLIKRRTNKIETDLITPIEFIEQSIQERIGKDVVVWYHKSDKHEESPVNQIVMHKHDCELHYFGCTGDAHFIARGKGHYESCLRVEEINYAVWREQLHQRVDKLEDSELYQELVGC